MTPEDVYALIGQGEGQRLEFKRSLAELAACRRKTSGTQISQIGADKELKSACISVNLRPASEETDFSDRLLGAFLSLVPTLGVGT